MLGTLVSVCIVHAGKDARQPITFLEVGVGWRMGVISVHKPIPVESQAAKLFLIFACLDPSNKETEAEELGEFKASLEHIV